MPERVKKIAMRSIHPVGAASRYGSAELVKYGQGWNDYSHIRSSGEGEVLLPVRPYEVTYVGRDRLWERRSAFRRHSRCPSIRGHRWSEAGEPVYFSGELLSVDLGPGLLGSVLDGIGRPLGLLANTEIYIGRGWKESPIPKDRRWPFKPRLKAGDTVVPGTALGDVAKRKAFFTWS